MTADSKSGIGPQHGASAPFLQSATSGKGKRNDDGSDNGDDGNSNDDGSNIIVNANNTSSSSEYLAQLSGGSQEKRGRTPWSSLFRRIDPSSMFNNEDEDSSPLIFSGLAANLGTLCLRTVAVATISLYILNQKHMLPMPVGKVVSKLLFWPTLPITVSRRIGQWTTVIDNAVVLGGAPIGWCGYPERLSKRFNVRGVVNMCDEYQGPVSSYKRLGIEHLRLPTVDHFEPSVDDLKKAVAFIQKHESQGSRVYVHCRAGHGRSGAAVMAWLLYKEPLADPAELNEKLCAMRNVRKGLWKQPNVNAFRVWLQSGGMMSDSSESEDSDDEWSKQRIKKRAIHWDDSDTEDSYSSDDSDGNILSSKFGQVFSDEESFTDDSSDTDRMYYDVEYDTDISEDGKDYEMWRNYQRDEL